MLNFDENVFFRTNVFKKHIFFVFELTYKIMKNIYFNYITINFLQEKYILLVLLEYCF